MFKMIFHYCRIPILIISMMVVVSCASVPKKPYYIDPKIEKSDTLKLTENEPQISRGRPNRFLDASDWFNPISLLNKLFLLNRKVDSHQISQGTVDYVIDYLEKNNLRNVKVRLNDYDVAGEWRRLARNKAISGGWRWTMGLIACIQYTVLPGRFFGGDNYNPYTNTINIYSDHPSIALHEAAHAKDFAKRKNKGLYTAAGVVPLASLYHEAKATGDVVDYLRDTDDIYGEAKAYKILYPAYCTYIGGEFADILEYTRIDNTIVNMVSYGFLIPGHITGRLKAWHRKRKYEKLRKSDFANDLIDQQLTPKPPLKIPDPWTQSPILLDRF